MTEITRVPLQPLAKGSMSKLWLGVIVAALAGVGIAAVGKPPLVDVKTLTAGTGRNPSPDDLIMINYQGVLPNGQVFDQADHAVLQMQGVVPGFAKALAQTQKGGKYRFTIPAKLGYGDRQVGPIPPNSDLTFNVEVVDFRNRAEVEQQQRMMEQIMRMRGAKGGAAGAPGEAGAGDAAGEPGAAPAGAQ